MALDLSGYKLTFQDEFGSFNRWTGEGSPGTWKTWFYFGDRTLNGNGERQYYMDADYKGSGSQPLGVNPFSVEADPTQAGDGVLDIEAKPTDPSVAPYIWNYPYTSGLITTEPTFSQTYGYFEMRAKMPEGSGLWPAFWLLPTDKSWPPEIDALEFFGGTNSRGEGGVTEYHWGAIGGSGDWIDVGVDLTEGMHNYGVEWTPTQLIYYFDGQEVARAATPAGFNKPMYMLANLAVGGNWPESPNGSTQFPAHLEIDYIRAYSNDPNAVPVDEPPTPTRPPDASAETTIRLCVAGDAWQGTPQLRLSVDGKQAGGTFVVSAARSANQWQEIEVRGDYGANGPARVEVHFINDAWGGTPATDRNLYINWIEVNGKRFEGEQAAANSGSARASAVDAILDSNGSVLFLTPGAPPAALAPKALFLSGTLGSDSMTAGEANDTLDGGDGDDRLWGLGGDDELTGGRGADVLTGGSGNDSALYAYSASSVRVDLMSGRGFFGDAQGDLFGSIEKVVGSRHSDELWGDRSANWLYGLEGDDMLRGDDGDDMLVGGAGADNLTGGSGVDATTYHNSDLGVRVDMVQRTGRFGDAEGDLFGSVENVIGSQFDDTIIGDNAANQLWGLGGRDDLLGGTGNDMLDGGAGNDRLWGEQGNDHLNGGAGADILTGGLGLDRFEFRRGEAAGDVVRDLQLGEDVLVFRGYAAGATLTAQGADAWTVADGSVSETITLIGIAALNPADYMFA